MGDSQELQLEDNEADAELLKLVSPDRRQAFQQFIRTGEADDDFLNFLNNDKDCQQAVEQAFTRQAAGFQDLAEALSHSREQPDIKQPDIIQIFQPHSAAVSQQIARTVELVIQAKPADRDRLVASHTAKIAATMPVKELGLVTKVVKALGNGLAKVNSV